MDLEGTVRSELSQTPRDTAYTPNPKAPTPKHRADCWLPEAGWGQHAGGQRYKLPVTAEKADLRSSHHNCNSVLSHVNQTCGPQCTM